MTKKEVREERAYLAYTSISLFIMEGSQDRNSKQGRVLEAGADAEAIEREVCCLLVCFP